MHSYTYLTLKGWLWRLAGNLRFLSLRLMVLQWSLALGPNSVKLLEP